MRAATITLVASAVTILSAQTGGKQFVRPPAGQSPPYSLAVKADGVIYVAGQLPTDAKGNLVPGDITAQARQVFDNLRAILKESGSSLDNSVSAVVMLENPSDFAALDQVYRQQFKGEPPARTTIIGKMVRPGALVEIQVTAVPDGAERKAILPAGWMKPTSPYNYAIKSGDTLYMSGLVARNGKDNSQVKGDVATQVKTIMDNAGEILRAADMSFGDIAAGRVALRDMAHFQALNDAYRTYWEKDRPARISCQCAPPGTFDVEITFVAIKGSSTRDVIVPPRADGSPGQIGPNFSPAIRVGRRLFVSGGTGTTDTNAGDMKGQTAETLARLGRSLKAAGFDYTDVVASDVFITDVAKFGEMNDGYRPVFPTDPPVRATMGVERFSNANALVEIMLTAVR
jgi:2-iminobutanoate/2-iminopropanoate deaminase